MTIQITHSTGVLKLSDQPVTCSGTLQDFFCIFRVHLEYVSSPGNQISNATLEVPLIDNCVLDKVLIKQDFSEVKAWRRCRVSRSHLWFGPRYIREPVDCAPHWDIVPGAGNSTGTIVLGTLKRISTTLSYIVPVWLVHQNILSMLLPLCLKAQDVLYLELNLCDSPDILCYSATHNLFVSRVSEQHSVNHISVSEHVDALRIYAHPRDAKMKTCSLDVALTPTNNKSSTWDLSTMYNGPRGIGGPPLDPVEIVYAIHLDTAMACHMNAICTSLPKVLKCMPADALFNVCLVRGSLTQWSFHNSVHVDADTLEHAMSTLGDLIMPDSSPDEVTFKADIDGRPFPTGYRRIVLTLTVREQCLSAGMQCMHRVGYGFGPRLPLQETVPQLNLQEHGTAQIALTGGAADMEMTWRLIFLLEASILQPRLPRLLVQRMQLLTAADERHWNGPVPIVTDQVVSAPLQETASSLLDRLQCVLKSIEPEGYWNASTVPVEVDVGRWDALNFFVLVMPDVWGLSDVDKQRIWTTVQVLYYLKHNVHMKAAVGLVALLVAKAELWCLKKLKGKVPLADIYTVVGDLFNNSKDGM